jgi:hypothetical protein
MRASFHSTIAARAAMKSAPIRLAEPAVAKGRVVSKAAIAVSMKTRLRDLFLRRHIGLCSIDNKLRFLHGTHAIAA